MSNEKIRAQVKAKKKRIKKGDTSSRSSSSRTSSSHTPSGETKLEGIDVEFAEQISPFLEGLFKYYFRCEITGWENLPKEQSLFVGNHNGLLTFEVVMLFHGWWKKFGTSRKAVALAHDIALKNPAFKWIIPKLGAVPANPEVAHAAFSQGFNVLVYPGGEKEAFRPYRDKNKVEFYGRKGFIRLALKEGVPIVPIVSIGAHESYVILDRGEEIAEKLGLKDKMRLHGVPMTYRLAFFYWCIATGVLTFFPLLLAPFALISALIPLPTKMQFKILPPMYIAEMVDPKLSEEENLQRIYDQVVGVMQAVLETGYRERRLPIIG